MAVYLRDPLSVVSAGACTSVFFFHIRVDGKSLDEGVNGRGGKSRRKGFASSRTGYQEVTNFTDLSGQNQKSLCSCGFVGSCAGSLFRENEYRSLHWGPEVNQHLSEMMISGDGGRRWGFSAVLRSKKITWT